MKVFTRTLHFFNLMSLDVVLGSMAGMYFFSEILETSSPLLSYFILGIAVWGIYTLDHLADARMINKRASSPRHQFHQKYFKVISLVWLVVGITGFSLLILSQEVHFVVIPGIILAFMMTLWMGFLKWMGEKLSWLKEISTALFYVIGITLVPWLLKDPEYDEKTYFLMLTGYLIIALINLLILSYIDKKGDENDGFGSILVLLSKSQLFNLIWILGIICLVFLMVILFWQPSYFRIHSSLLLAMLLFHLIQLASIGKDLEMVRQKMEAVFILPLVLIII
ncbi:hypothetical protein [Aquiflexum lacus]|uniref:hypothetical protein n=1 Tax=Aquiflexum lacus TaxID=2483805 RepID=UPI00189406D9|nr:hypothetical protein [Aquiflexum lacus]